MRRRAPGTKRCIPRRESGGSTALAVYAVRRNSGRTMAVLKHIMLIRDPRRANLPHFIDVQDMVRWVSRFPRPAKFLRARASGFVVHDGLFETLLQLGDFLWRDFPTVAF